MATLSHCYHWHWWDKQATYKLQIILKPYLHQLISLNESALVLHWRSRLETTTENFSCQKVLVLNNGVAHATFPTPNETCPAHKSSWRKLSLMAPQRQIHESFSFNSFPLYDTPILVTENVSFSHHTYPLPLFLCVTLSFSFKMPFSIVMCRHC